MNHPNANQPQAPPPFLFGLTFDTRRDVTLNVPLPALQAGANPSISTTRARHRLRWNHLHEWQNFDQYVLAYWNQQFVENDKPVLVANLGSIQVAYSRAANGLYLTESNISDALMFLPAMLHQYAANGEDGAPLPSDVHSKFFRCSQGAGSFGLVGVPDFVLRSANSRITALLEVKNPWLVTPQQIDQVIDGIA